MDNKTFKKLRLQTVQASKTFQPFHKLVENKDAIKDLERHTGWKLIQEYLKILVDLNTEELKHNYINKDGKDVSEIIRGKLEAFEGILNLNNAIEGYKQLKNEVDEITKKEKEAEKGS